uniref:Uncharacterized protein n=1 Tax=Hanusia phi TaxID=3032 RepID=A0A7S0EIS2_9CRYP|mmetsp:Transcript_25469/g.57338  ORF Transcript_25469/g.57338 Transcript_25469/m.57338 type:complete len:197 (+) Transcript_25469:1-591(+)
MELLAHPTHQCSPPQSVDANVTSAAEDLPNFNTVSSGLFSTFLLFVEDWNGLVHIADKSGSPIKIAIVSGYFMMGYVIMGIGLCNLLTNLVVEFMQVWQAEDVKARKKALLNKFKGAAHVIMAKNRLRRMMSFIKEEKKQPHSASPAAPAQLERFETSREMLQQARDLVSEQLEYMVAPVDGSWRTRLWMHSKEDD